MGKNEPIRVEALAATQVPAGVWEAWLPELVDKTPKNPDPAANVGSGDGPVVGVLVVGKDVLLGGAVVQRRGAVLHVHESWRVSDLQAPTWVDLIRHHHPEVRLVTLAEPSGAVAVRNGLGRVAASWDGIASALRSGKEALEDVIRVVVHGRQ